jgi:DNA primase
VKGEKKFDRFKGRVMFPIQNISGRVIGFGGRTLSADKKTAKYLNSPESDIYHKSQVLYGLNHAKKSVIAKDNCYLVEGYTDVISFHQNGVENVVSSSGTSLTTDQIRLLKRYTKTVTILFDGDAAGIKAAFRGIDMILEEGLNVKVLSFPEGEDPDSYAKAHSNEELRSFLEKEVVDFIRFKTSLLLEETGSDPIKRAGLIKDIVGSIALIPDAIARSVYLQECSNLMDIGEQALLSELNKVRRNKLTKRIQEQERADNRESAKDEALNDISVEASGRHAVDVLDVQERDIIRTLIKFGNKQIVIPTDKTEKAEEENQSEAAEEAEDVEASVAEYLIFAVEEDGMSFKNSTYNDIYAFFKTAVDKEELISENELVSHQNKEISSIVIECLLEKYSLSLNWEEKHKILTITEDDVLPMKVHKGICSWRLNKVQEMIEERQKQLKKEPEVYEEIYIELVKLFDAKKALANELGRIILR